MKWPRGKHNGQRIFVGPVHIGYCIGCQRALYSNSGGIMGPFGRWYHHRCLSKDDRARLKSTIIDASKAVEAAGDD